MGTPIRNLKLETSRLSAYNGTCTKRQMTEAERAAYGPPANRKPGRRHLTAAHLLEAVATSASAEEAAAKMGMPVQRFKTELTTRRINRVEYGTGVEG
jgi:hypothetical protein